MRRQDENTGRRCGRDDPARGVQSIELRHRQVEYHDVRLELGRQSNRIPAVGRFRRHHPTGYLGKFRRHAASEEFVIIRDQNAHGLHGLTPSRSRGPGIDMAVQTRVPAPVDSTEKVPPICRMRSRMPARPTPSGGAAGIPRPPSSISSMTVPACSREPDGGPRACGMAMHVRQRFLSNPKQAKFMVRGQTLHCLRQIEPDLDLAPLAKAVGQPAQRTEQSKLIEQRRMQ